MLEKMQSNFPVQAQRGLFESEIREKRNTLNSSLKAQFESTCQCGSLTFAIQIIDDQIEKLNRKVDQ